MSNIEKPLDALMNLLMRYDNNRKSIFGEINALLNTGTYFTQPELIKQFDALIKRAAKAELMYNTAYNLISMAHAEVEKKRAAAAGASQPTQE